MKEIKIGEKYCLCNSSAYNNIEVEVVKEYSKGIYIARNKELKIRFKVSWQQLGAIK